MKVLLSIKPEFAERILNGEKKFEFRKTLFKNEKVTTVVIYATMPTGKVVGEFEVGPILKDCPSTLWRRTKEFSGISKEFFEAYFQGHSSGYAISVRNAVRYDDPLELDALIPGGVPPQSFRYLDSSLPQ